MAITSERQLAQLLANMESLSNDDRIEIMKGAWFVKGRLRGLYIAPMMSKGNANEIKTFFTGAGALLFTAPGGQGVGLPGGGRVYADYYPTGHDNPPCVPRDGFSCWVPDSSDWEPGK
jgi:hypothetical protein